MEQKDYKYISVAYKLYDITDNKQELIEETAKDKPFVFLSGFGTTLEDFESNLVGLAEGADFDFVLSPDRAYGEHVDTRVVELDKQIFSVDGKFDSKNIYPEAIVPLQNEDGNRFLGRVVSIGSDKVKKRFREALRDIYPTGECGAFTSALMELGETVCTVGTPSCARCPVAAYCAAHRCGEEALYPVLPEKKPRRIENRRVLLLLCGDTCAVQRRADTGLLASMWELPNDLLPDAPETGEPCGEAVHIFSHVEWHMRGYIVRCREKLPGYVWVTRAEREALAMPTAFRYYRKKLEEMGY